MAFLAFFLKRLGWRKIMIFGILGHAARFFIFAVGDPLTLMIAINVLHGFCYAFFFASVYIFVDEYFPRDSRASAQSLFNLLILGMGPFIGALRLGQDRGHLHGRGRRRLPQAVPLPRRPRRGGGGAAARRVPSEGAAERRRPREDRGRRIASRLRGARGRRQYPQHDRNRPAPKVVAPGAAVSAPAPADAIVLFDGKDLSKWRSQKDKGAARVEGRERLRSRS